MLSRILDWLLPKRRGKHTSVVAGKEYAEADSLASFILIEHTDKANDLLQDYGYHIEVTDDELVTYIETGKVPLKVAAMAALARPILLQGMHSFLAGWCFVNRTLIPSEKHRDKETENLLRDYVRDWSIVGGRMAHRHFFDYLPVSCKDIPDAYSNVDYTEIRHLVWNFKYGNDSVTPYRHVNAMYKVVDLLADDINRTFGADASKLTFFCVPASTYVKNWLRYCEFSMLLCKRTGMANSFEHIYMLTNRKAKHAGGERKDNYTLDPEYFNGRFILMFDDVVTTGKSLRNASYRLKEAGAIVIGAYSIAQSVKLKK